MNSRRIPQDRSHPIRGVYITIYYYNHTYSCVCGAPHTNIYHYSLALAYFFCVFATVRCSYTRDVYNEIPPHYIVINAPVYATTNAERAKRVRLISLSISRIGVFSLLCVRFVGWLGTHRLGCRCISFLVCLSLRPLDVALNGCEMVGRAADGGRGKLHE